MTIQTYSKIVTPKIATVWLTEWNVHNRPIKNKRVDQYARDMKAGKWKENGESIIFGKTRLLDGQHRLWACIEADMPFKTLVTEGVSDDAFDTIDVGMTRTSSDILSIGNYGKNAATLGAAAVLCIGYRKGNLMHGAVTPKHEVRAFVDENPEIVEWVDLARRGKGWTNSYAAPLAALLYLGSFKHRDKADEFLDGFGTGENLRAGSPILALRNRIGTEKRMRREQRFALFVSAWNAFVGGRELTKVQLPRADRETRFPVILGARKPDEK
ncbi:MAG: hypothetical protein GC182_09045 [Rhodopseudomonas sp.]|nr:hypothetical protein [Rhodopseudomonas sp.]